MLTRYFIVMFTGYDLNYVQPLRVVTHHRIQPTPGIVQYSSVVCTTYVTRPYAYTPFQVYIIISL